jgi:hypothetical protein
MISLFLFIAGLLIGFFLIGSFSTKCDSCGSYNTKKTITLQNGKRKKFCTNCGADA